MPPLAWNYRERECPHPRKTKTEPMKKKSSVLLLLSFLAASSFALPVSAWLPIDSVTQAAISSGRIPGAVVCVVKDTSVVYLKAFGNRQVDIAQFVVEVVLQCYLWQ